MQVFLFSASAATFDVKREHMRQNLEGVRVPIWNHIQESNFQEALFGSGCISIF
jgi:hypothetical protein